MYKTLLVLLFFALIYSSQAQINNPIDFEGCGISYIHRAIKVATRVQGQDAPGNPMPVTFQVTELPDPCYEIVAAYVWSTVSYTAGSPDPATVQVVNPLNQTSIFPSLKVGQSIPKCWSELGTRCFRTDIKNSISGNGAYQISINTRDNETDGITMIIIYKDLKTSDEGHLHLRDGIITLGSSGATTNTQISGFNVCESTSNAVGFLIVADMQIANVGKPTFDVIVNGTPFSPGRNFWNSETLPISVAQGQNTIDFSVNPTAGDCYSVALEGFYYKSTTCKTCPEPLLAATAQVDKNQVCYNDQVQLNVTAASSYDWTSDPPGFTSTLKNPTATMQQNTKFYARIYDANACRFGLDSVSVSVFPQLLITPITNVSICYGSSTTLQPTTNQTAAPYTFKWSPATGLDNPNSQNVIASPTTTTVYTLTVTDGNGCSDQKNVTVTVNPLPVTNAGRDTAICMGSSITLNATVSAGTPPFTYDWNPKTQITNGANSLTPTITLNTSSDFYLTVTDVNGCIARDTIYIKAFPLPQPVITPNGPTRFCSCDSVTLDAGNLGYTTYKWSTGAITQKITVNTPGSYSVTVTDTNGCFNTSAPINIQVIYPTTTVGFASPLYQANSGDTIRIPFVIKSSTYLDTCHSFNYTAQIRFNKSLISPVLNTPKGNKTSDERIIIFNGVRTPNDTVLSIFNFIATLGDSEQTNLTIDSFVWNDCPFATNAINSVFALSDLCKEGNITRLIRQVKSSAILDVVPNPIGTGGKISYELGLDTHYSIFISDILGNKVLTIDDGTSKSGKYNKFFDMNDLSSGTYFIVLKTATETVSKVIEVSK